MNPTILIIVGTYGTIALIFLLNRRRLQKRNEDLKLAREYLKAKGCWPKFPKKEKKKEPLPHEDDVLEEETLRIEGEDYDAYADEEDD